MLNHDSLGDADTKEGVFLPFNFTRRSKVSEHPPPGPPDDNRVGYVGSCEYPNCDGLVVPFELRLPFPPSCVIGHV